MQYIQHLGVGLDSFAHNCGLSTKALLGLQITQRYLLHKVIEAYPTLNKQWLETGEGEMICTPPRYPRSIAIEAESENHSLSDKIKSIEPKPNATKLKTTTNDTTIRDRLLLYINYLGITVKDFAISCSITESSVYNIKNKNTTQIFNKIYAAYPRLNPIWLQKGEGDMERLTGAVESSLYERIKEENAKLTELITNRDREIANLHRMLEEKDKIISKLAEKL